MHFNHGYFTKGPKHINAQFDNIEPYALVALEAAIQGKSDLIPPFIDGKGVTDGGFEFPDGTVRMVKEQMVYDVMVKGIELKYEGYNV